MLTSKNFWMVIGILVLLIGYLAICAAFVTTQSGCVQRDAVRTEPVQTAGVGNVQTGDVKGAETVDIKGAETVDVKGADSIEVAVDNRGPPIVQESRPTAGSGVIVQRTDQSVRPNDPWSTRLLILILGAQNLIAAAVGYAVVKWWWNRRANGRLIGRLIGRANSRQQPPNNSASAPPPGPVRPVRRRRRKFSRSV